MMPIFPVSDASRRDPRGGASGAALIIVLAILVLLVGLIVAFLTRTLVERGATDAYAASSATSRLADVAVNLVQGQIRDATTQGASVAWTSQPGMIRTFGTGSGGAFAPSDSLLRVFKLYSAEELISTTYTQGSDTAPPTWQGSPALWTDLNMPVVITNPAGGPPDKVPIFPILDPRALDAVEGFDVNSASSPVGSILSGGVGSWRLPMPVRWIYVLQDGQMVTPPETSGTTATIAGATADNPVIGRVAFWTDDETSKININTASEGTPWDTPRTQTAADQDLARYQPTFNEFQRYPGHPGMTSLAPVLFATSRTTTPVLSAAQRDALYKVAPRIEPGGSNAGTPPSATDSIPLDTDRLYASLDELIFAASERLAQPENSGLTRERLESAKFFLTAYSQAPEVTLFNTPRVAVWPLFRDLIPGRVTAYDRLIAFCATIGEPPDQHRYYFQRENSRSPTADWANIPRNRHLLRYLQALSSRPIPGFGASLVSKTTVQDRDQLLVAMMDYIRSTNLYDDNLTPTTYATEAAAKSASQFTSGRRANEQQVWAGHGNVAPLRVPAGIPDSATYPAEPDPTSPMGFGRFHTITEAGLLFICTADGTAGTTASPIDAGAAADVRRASNDPDTNRTLNGVPLASDERRVQAMLFFDFLSVMQGWTQYSTDSSIDVELVGGNFTLNGESLEFPTVTSFDQPHVGGTNYHPWGGHMGFRQPLFNRYTEGDPLTENRTLYPLVSRPVTIKVPEGGNPTMQFVGPTTIVIKIYSNREAQRAAGDADLVQTIEMRFPNADFPVPVLKTTGTNAGGGAPQTPRETWWTFNTDGAVGEARGRIAYVTQQSVSSLAGDLVRWEDTFRTLVPYHADYRLVAGSHFVPEGVFQPSSGYFGTTRQIISGSNPTPNPENPPPQIRHTMTGSARSTYDGGLGFYMPPAQDRLVAGATYRREALPKFPSFADSGGTVQSARSFQQYGDFDNGVAYTVDGAYVNKPDEGNTYGLAAGLTPYFSDAWRQVASGSTFFSPNRQTPGPGMFGSLPTRLMSGNQPFTTMAANSENTWRTLLFRPQSGHPGAVDPPDHLWLDFFWMPVVEPYAISSPFATAGKINMNYGIEPFSYIRRATGMIALLRAEQMMAVPIDRAPNYKGGSGVATDPTYRLSIDAHETLKQFENTFTQGQVFISASEICDIHLIPTGLSLNPTGTNGNAVMQAFWQDHALTGDNSRERPYANIQGRLTTKSNAFTVHYRVQTLKKTPGSPGAWDENRDVVTGERRGSTTIERYINPNEANIPDYAREYSDNPSAVPDDIGQIYKWRIVSTREFAP